MDEFDPTEDIDEYLKPELQEFCEKRDLSKAGTKQELYDRLLEAAQGDTDDAPEEMEGSAEEPDKRFDDSAVTNRLDETVSDLRERFSDMEERKEELQEKLELKQYQLKKVNNLIEELQRRSED